MSAAAADLGTLIKSFFTRHLAAEYNASGHTIRSYRDTFRSSLRHVAAATGPDGCAPIPPRPHASHDPELPRLSRAGAE